MDFTTPIETRQYHEPAFYQFLEKVHADFEQMINQEATIRFLRHDIKVFQETPSLFLPFRQKKLKPKESIY